MTWFVTTLAVVLIVITTAAVLGRVDGSIAEPTSSLAHEPLPDGPLTAQDLDELRFDTGLRGYRMAQVDRVVDRLRREITVLEEEVARLRAEGSADPEPAADRTPEPVPEPVPEKREQMPEQVPETREQMPEQTRGQGFERPREQGARA